MGTASLTHFIDGDLGSPVATIYRHWDGYPEEAGKDIYRFLAEVEAQTTDTRFSDPSYLAAKYVVFLAGIFAESEATEWVGDERIVNRANVKPLKFLSVGIVPGECDYGQEFVYTVDCSARDDSGRPAVSGHRATADGKRTGRPLAIPRPEPVS